MGASSTSTADAAASRCLAANGPQSPHLAAGTDLITHSLGDRLAPGIERFPDLLHEDVVLETPFNGDGTDKPVEGRADLEAMVRCLDGVVFIESARTKAVHEGTDGRTFIYGCDGVVRFEGTGRRFARAYVAVGVLREGRISHLREYGGPLVPIP